MIAALLAAALAAGPRVPEGSARYRVEIAGAPVGVSELSISCAAGGDRCSLRWTSRLRFPAASGGTLRTRRIQAVVDGRGRLGDAEVEVEVDGVGRFLSGGPETVPLALAELVLAARGGGCIEALDEETGRTGPACARVEAGRLRVEALGVVEDVTAGKDGFPDAVEIPAQGTRFVRDATAEVPDAAPRLEVRVPGPQEGRTPSRFCGRMADAGPPRADLSAFPEPRPDGSSCREQAQAYAAALRARGIPARVAVGVAHDGAGFVWHAWAEGRTGAGWLAVDPAFGQLPARGPRFTIARQAGDAAGVAEAGRRILECWGRVSVE